MLSNKNKIHGWINFDKPAGISSAKAVAIVRKKLNCSKIGHGGTLDPLASGVLPIAVGEATKTVSYVMDRAKKYEVVTSCYKVGFLDGTSFRTTSSQLHRVLCVKSPLSPAWGHWRRASTAATPRLTGRF